MRGISDPCVHVGWRADGSSRAVDVDAAEFEPRCDAGIEVAVKPGEQVRAFGIDRSGDEGHQVEIAHVRTVVTGRRRTADQQVSDPSEPVQARTELLKRGQRRSHKTILAGRIRDARGRAAERAGRTILDWAGPRGAPAVCLAKSAAVVATRKCAVDPRLTARVTVGIRKCAGSFVGTP